MKGACIPDAEGWQYGVRYQDGSIAHGWNGRTQLDRAQEHIFLHAKLFNGERLTLVRREVYGTPGKVFTPYWVHVDIDPWRKPLTNVVYTPPGFVNMGKPGYFWRGNTVALAMCRQAGSRLKIKLIKGEHQ